MKTQAGLLHYSNPDSIRPPALQFDGASRTAALLGPGAGFSFGENGQDFLRKLMINQWIRGILRPSSRQAQAHLRLWHARGRAAANIGWLLVDAKRFFNASVELSLVTAQV